MFPSNAGLRFGSVGVSYFGCAGNEQRSLISPCDHESAHATIRSSSRLLYPWFGKSFADDQVEERKPVGILRYSWKEIQKKEKEALFHPIPGRFNYILN